MASKKNPISGRWLLTCGAFLVIVGMTIATVYGISSLVSAVFAGKDKESIQMVITLILAIFALLSNVVTAIVAFYFTMKRPNGESDDQPTEPLVK